MLLLCAGATTAGDSAETKRFNEELARARDLDTQDKELSSLSVGGLFTLWDIQLLYSASRGHAMMLRDPNDGTPLCWMTDDRFFAYDPETAQIIRVRTADIRVRMYIVNETVKFGFYASGPLHAHPGSRFELQTRGLFSMVPRNRAVQTAADGTSRLTGLTKFGGSLTLLVQGGKRHVFPCRTLRMTGRRGERLALLHLAANRPIDSSRFDRISPTKLLNSPLSSRIRDRKMDLDDPEAFIGPLRRGAFIRTGLSDPSKRKLLQKPDDPAIDWEKLAKTDSVISAQLRALYPPVRTSGPDGVKELLAKLELVDTSQGSISTLALRGRLADNDVEVYERNGRERTVCIRDPHDGTPVWMMGTTQTYYYDVFRNALVRFKLPAPTIRCQLKRRGLVSTLFWAHDDRRGIHIDPRTFVGHLRGSVHRIPYPDRIVVSRGNRLSYHIEFHLERRGRHPFRSIVLHAPGQEAQSFDLVVNAVLPDTWSPDLFDAQLRDSSIRIIQEAQPDLGEESSFWTDIKRVNSICSVRMAIYDESRRAQLEQYFQRKIEWGELEAQDLEFSKRLRELVPRLPMPARGVPTSR